MFFMAREQWLTTQASSAPNTEQASIKGVLVSESPGFHPPLQLPAQGKWRAGGGEGVVHFHGHQYTLGSGGTLHMLRDTLYLHQLLLGLLADSVPTFESITWWHFKTNIVIKILLTGRFLGTGCMGGWLRKLEFGEGLEVMKLPFPPGIHKLKNNCNSRRNPRLALRLVTFWWWIWSIIPFYPHDRLMR